MLQALLEQRRRQTDNIARRARQPHRDRQSSVPVDGCNAGLISGISLSVEVRNEGIAEIERIEKLREVVVEHPDATLALQ